MMRLTISILVGFCFSCFPDSALTQQTVTDRADAVVVAEVISGQQTGSHVSFALRVDRTLKGSIAPGSVVSVEWDGARAAPKAQQVSADYGIWFLRASTSGPWRLLPANPSNAALALSLACYSLPKGSAPSLSPGPRLSPHDLLAIELAAGLEQLPPGSLQFYYAASGLLSMPATPTIGSLHRRLSQSAQPRLRELGLIGLVRQGDVGALEQIVQQPQEASRTTNMSWQMVSGVRNLRDGTPRGVGALGRLATTTQVGIGMQEAAADALRAIHNQESLPFLAALLDSPDPKMRHHGLARLGMFVENLPIQMPDMVPSMAWLKPMGRAPYRTADTD